MTQAAAKLQSAPPRKKCAVTFRNAIQLFQRYWSRCILFISLGATILVFVLAPKLCGGYLSMSDQLTCWLHDLAIVALLSTLIWSAAGFFTIYVGPHQLWDHKDELGRRVFIYANLLCFFSIFFYVVGIVGVWTGWVHEHLLCIAIAEGSFWLFDKIVIRRIKELQDEWAKPMPVSGSADEPKPALNDRSWATDLRDRLSAWKDYVDRPTTLAFLVLYGGGRYLEHGNHTLLNSMEVELFSAGAVFFALMTANLAFYAANKPIDVLITEPDRNQHHSERAAPSAA